MLANKQALIRYRIINRMLENGQYVTKNEIIEACREALDGKQISSRTIDADIEAMRYDTALGYDAPIHYNRSKRAYHYTETGYSIEKFPVSKDELQSMAFAAKLLEQYQKMEILEEFSDAVQKILSVLHMRRLFTEKPLDFIQFEHRPVFNGDVHLKACIDAISNEEVVFVTYRAYNKGKAYTHTVHPYYLKEYMGRWYLFGYNAYWKEERTYALDRIEELHVKHSATYFPCRYDPATCFKDVIGIHHGTGDKPQEMLLRLSADIAPYCLNQPVHDSQRVKEATDDYTLISIYVHPTPELVGLILSWGSHIEVIAPDTFRLEIKRRIKELLENY
ncbi:MAG: WYL domain-containing protein [Bacteroidales bacterium]|nr:WYL domain-containing protein [Bacteroidales bacterium]